MKRARTAIIALACGIACAACVLLYLQDVGAKADAARAEALERFGGDQLEVCVAKRDIAAGETLDEASFERRLWVADLLPENPITSPAEAIGKQATSTILKGEVLTSRRFDEVLSAVEVPSELTAVSVPARDVQTIGGALQPGMLVDVYATGQTSANLIAHGVLVLATNASAQSKTSSESVSWVTLALSPENVQEVVAVAQATQLYFTLPGDDVPEPEDLPSANAQESEGKASGAQTSNVDKAEQAPRSAASTDASWGAAGQKAEDASASAQGQSFEEEKR